MQKATEPERLSVANSGWTFTSIKIAYGLLFALLYAQAPLFTGNQHTKFLQAAAQTGYGFLKSDWTANTIDPLPAFTWLIYPVFAYLPLATFHVMLGGLFFVFGYAAASLAGVLHRTRSTQPIPLEVASLFGGLLLLFSVVVISMTRGVANQYMLSHILQPCVFGVFILLGLYLWVTDRRGLASAALAIGAIFHPGAYLLTSTILLVVLLLSSRAQLTLTKAAVPAAIYLLLVAPLMIYQAMSLSPTTPEAFARAADILANTRIPKHTNVALWFDGGAAAKFAWMILACVLVRRQRQLFWCLTALTAFAIVSSAALWLFPNAGMRFSTPWRVTTVTMPLATIIVLYYAGAWLSEILAPHASLAKHVRRGVVAAFVLLCLVLGAQTLRHYLRHVPHATDGAVAYARQHAGEGQNYLVPPGQFEFRLATGLPFVASFKSHPYKDVEVLEWNDRVAAANKIYVDAAKPETTPAAREALDRYGVTHVLLPAGNAFSVPGFKQVYVDDKFSILRRD